MLQGVTEKNASILLQKSLQNSLYGCQPINPYKYAIYQTNIIKIPKSWNFEKTELVNVSHLISLEIEKSIDLSESSVILDFLINAFSKVSLCVLERIIPFI